MTKRINIVLSDRLNEMLDELSEAYGVSKSSIAAMAIGQHVEALMKQRDMLYGDDGLMKRVKEKLLSETMKHSVDAGQMEMDMFKVNSTG